MTDTGCASFWLKKPKTHAVQLARAAVFPRASYSPYDLLMMLMHCKGSKWIAATFASVLLADPVEKHENESTAQIGSSRKDETKTPGSSEHVLWEQAMKRKANLLFTKKITGGSPGIPLDSEGSVLLVSWCHFPHSSWRGRGRLFFKNGFAVRHKEKWAVLIL